MAYAFVVQRRPTVDVVTLASISVDVVMSEKFHFGWMFYPRLHSKTVNGILGGNQIQLIDLAGNA